MYAAKPLDGVKAISMLLSRWYMARGCGMPLRRSLVDRQIRLANKDLPSEVYRRATPPAQFLVPRLDPAT